MREYGQERQQGYTHQMYIVINDSLAGDVLRETFFFFVSRSMGGRA